MGPQRRRAKCSSFVADNARFHHDASRRAEQSAAAKRKPAAAKRRAPVGCGTLASRSLTRGVPGFLRGAQHLVDEALRFRRAGAANAPGSNTQIAVARRHGRASRGARARTVPKISLIALLKMHGAARTPTDRHGRTQAMPMACGSSGEALLSRRPAVVVPHCARHPADASPRHAIACLFAQTIIAVLPHQISRRTGRSHVEQWPRCHEWTQLSKIASAGAHVAPGQRELSGQSAQ